MKCDIQRGDYIRIGGVREWGKLIQQARKQGLGWSDVDIIHDPSLVRGEISRERADEVQDTDRQA